MLFDRPKVEALIRKWLADQWLAPSDLAKEADLEIRGVYLPYHLWKMTSSTIYKGGKGKNYVDSKTRTKTVRGKKGQVRNVRTTTSRVKTRWDHTSGTVRADHCIPVELSHEVAGVFRVDNWRFAGAVRPKPDEYPLVTRSVDATASFNEAERRLTQEVEWAIKMRIGGDVQRIKDYKKKVTGRAKDLIYAPVWCGFYSYNGKRFSVVANGQTGALYVDGYPRSAGKYLALCLAVVTIAAVIVALLWEAFGPPYDAEKVCRHGSQVVIDDYLIDANASDIEVDPCVSTLARIAESSLISRREWEGWEECVLRAKAIDAINECDMEFLGVRALLTASGQRLIEEMIEDGRLQTQEGTATGKGWEVSKWKMYYPGDVCERMSDLYKDDLLEHRGIDLRNPDDRRALLSACENTLWGLWGERGEEWFQERARCVMKSTTSAEADLCEVF